MRWSLNKAESSIVIVVDMSKPTFVLLDTPIHLVDEILCKSLDMVEDALPIVKSEPTQMYQATKEYVASVINPVVKKADFVKEIQVQNARAYSNYAAETIDNALTMADQYVDKYLPEIDSNTSPLDPCNPQSESGCKSPVPTNQTEKTIRHVNKFSRNLKRKLTQRTLYEARELKKQGENLLNFLIQLADLLAEDPKAFAQKMKDLWIYLSLDEPENQAPAQNVEQLIMMLTREGARRFVHLTNFTVASICKIPGFAKKNIVFALHKYDQYAADLSITSIGIQRQIEIIRHTLKSILDKLGDSILPVLIPPKGRNNQLSTSVCNSKNCPKENKKKEVIDEGTKLEETNKADERVITGLAGEENPSCGKTTDVQSNNSMVEGSSIERNRENTLDVVLEEHNIPAKNQNDDQNDFKVTEEQTNKKYIKQNKSARIST